MSEGSEVLTIDESELSEVSEADRLHKPSDNTDTLVTSDRGDVFVRFGIPLNPANKEFIQIQDSPYVFVTDHLFVRDGRHTAHALAEKPSLKTHPEHIGEIDLGKATVMLAHGESTDGTWRFANGAAVVDTVRAYNAYAAARQLPRVDLIVACNPENTMNSARPEGIQFGEFGEEDLNSTMAYAVGESILAHGTSAQGTTNLHVIAQGPMFNLDKLITYKSVFPQD